MNEIKEKILRWQELKQIETSAKNERSEIEAELMTDHRRMEGRDEIAFSDDQIFVITYKSKTEIDQSIAAELDAKYKEPPFRKKYDLDKKLYDSIEKLSPEAHQEFSRAVTLKPARPTFEIKERKGK